MLFFRFSLRNIPINIFDSPSPFFKTFQYNFALHSPIYVVEWIPQNLVAIGRRIRKIILSSSLPIEIEGLHNNFDDFLRGMGFIGIKLDCQHCFRVGTSVSFC